MRWRAVGDALPRAYLKNRREDRCLDIGWFLPATVAVDAAAHGETPGAVLRFCAALRYPECKVLAGALTLVQFERGGAREEEMTYAQATAFIRKALEMGRAGVIPADRALSMGIGVAAQFELLLRQKDIIGDWGGPNGHGQPRRRRHGGRGSGGRARCHPGRAYALEEGYDAALHPAQYGQDRDCRRGAQPQVRERRGKGPKMPREQRQNPLRTLFRK